MTKVTTRPTGDDAATTDAVDLTSSVSFLVGVIANKVVASSSKMLRRRFGVGFTEWRIILMLSVEPGSTALRMCEIVGMDKAAASRSLKELVARGLVAPTAATAARRSRGYELTRAGRALLRAATPLVRESRRLLLARIKLHEEPVLLDLLRRLLAQIPVMEAFDERG